MIPSNNSDQVEETASAWLARHEGGAWSADDQAALEAWLNTATAHRIAYLRLVTAWERSGRLKALGAGISAGTIPPRDTWGFAAETPSRPADAAWEPVRRTRRWVAMAAGLVAATAAGAAWLYSMSRAPAYSTPIGVLATLPLADGSTITLNTDSKIHVELGSTERIVTLDRGEAFFEVAKDPARPFVVAIGRQRVTAIGTQFAVRRDQSDIRVLVTEGRVQVARESLLSRSAATPVTAGATAYTAQDAVIVEVPKPEQVEESLSWRSGYLVFHDTPLAEAIAEFNRYNVRKIVSVDPSIASLRIGGRFRFADSAAFLWLLQSGFPIRVVQDNQSVRLTRR